MSAYLILEMVDKGPPGPTWIERDTAGASSAEAAVRAFVKDHNAKGGVFLAIPERSAKTIRVEVETVQKVSVKSGDDD